MKIRLLMSFGTSRNVVPVVMEEDRSATFMVGEMNMVRRSGWRGGPTYHFHPNDYGANIGLKLISGASIRGLLQDLMNTISK
jgi:hypothetical protein